MKMAMIMTMMRTMAIVIYQEFNQDAWTKKMSTSTRDVQYCDRDKVGQELPGRPPPSPAGAAHRRPPPFGGEIVASLRIIGKSPNIHISSKKR